MKFHTRRSQWGATGASAPPLFLRTAQKSRKLNLQNFIIVNSESRTSHFKKQEALAVGVAGICTLEVTVQLWECLWA